jgi:PAS domain S-box-containing protein
MNGNLRQSGNIDKAELFNLLLDRTDDLLIVTDARLRLVFLSRNLLDITELPSEALLGHTVAESGLFREHAQALHECLHQAVRTAEPAQIEIVWMCGDSERIYRIRVQTHLDGGSVCYVLARARDITERRRIEKDPREWEHEFCTLAENTPDNIVHHGLDRRTIYCNREIKDRVLEVSAGLAVRAAGAGDVPPARPAHRPR